MSNRLDEMTVKVEQRDRVYLFQKSVQLTGQRQSTEAREGEESHSVVGKTQKFCMKRNLKT